ncbi:hypothetical protein P154DRAFT_439355 [Amniculicola lignicola CBS 123094]|uniref:Zn(2)-C6 fungal-type domain-containing protein n=1 Tax=Amniculicola lignicola CBS 123094 TaxID=1392246 RepID=A0A6A5WGS8_9PLEO|nr:hypothetical protein P154DRAFT_439355 [Amniculicola lignicola CBS 123094]
MYWYTRSPPQQSAHYDPFQTPEQGRQQFTQERNKLPVPAAAEPSIRNGSKKRRACNECKQQKLRCDLSTLIHRTSETCSRCTRLGLECRIDRSFKRERKRKRSDELEKEVNSLRKELSRRSTSIQVVPTQPGEYGETSVSHKADNIESDSASTSSTYNLQGTSEIFSSPALSNAIPGSTCQSYSLPAATSPYLDLVPIGFDSDHEIYDSIPSNEHVPRSLDELQLVSEEIDELFLQYFTHFHPFLPILDPQLSPTDYYNKSTFLFWVIIAVASRRFEQNPTLITILAQLVTKLTWDTLQSIPSSKDVIQGLALLCTWPFPANSRGTGVSYMWAGTMVNLAIQMGLHRPSNALTLDRQDRNSVGLDEAERMKLWAACNIVTQRVSVGAGLTAPIQHDWNSILASQHAPLNPDLRLFLQLEAFRDSVSRTVTPNGSDLGGLLDAHERSFLYEAFLEELASIETNSPKKSAIGHFYILAARLHLQSFCLVGEPSAEGFTDRILGLYFTAVGIIQHTLNMERLSSSIVRHGPFSVSQTLISAAFIVLKVIQNDTFVSFIDLDTGRKIFQYSMTAIRHMSVNNNDNPSEMAKVLTFFWKNATKCPVSQPGKEGLQLRVRSRMSMSVVYDCLWRWQACMQIHSQGANGFPDENQGKHTDFP